MPWSGVPTRREAANSNFDRKGLRKTTSKNARAYMLLSIKELAGQILSEEEMALRLSASLMAGCVRIYSFKYMKLQDKAKNAQSDFVRTIIAWRL